MLICEVCKRPYKMAWIASDHMWQTISGHKDDGLICPACFDSLAQSKGVVLAWYVADEPKEDIKNIISKE